ncbi:hypothetical protein JTB14_014724 [Gonioctena quinquepunctata]|nr:hypothetical protein JTB14_014724 [Gonioctena quinquepunctata]
MPQHTSTICTDSLSAIEAISDAYNDNALVQNILALIHHLLEMGKRTILIWTPGHVHIQGNVLADIAARNATEDDSIENIPILVSDLKKHFGEIVSNRWEAEWVVSHGKLRQIKTTTRIWKNPVPMKRRDQVALTRLRIGHTNLTSSFMLSGERPPQCQTCQVRLTVKQPLGRLRRIQGPQTPKWNPRRHLKNIIQ